MFPDCMLGVALELPCLDAPLRLRGSLLTLKWSALQWQLFVRSLCFSFVLFFSCFADSGPLAMIKVSF